MCSGKSANTASKCSENEVFLISIWVINDPIYKQQVWKPLLHKAFRVLYFNFTRNRRVVHLQVQTNVL